MVLSLHMHSLYGLFTLNANENCEYYANQMLLFSVVYVIWYGDNETVVSMIRKLH